jgi:methionine-rich copper-binding protein CopC
MSFKRVLTALAVLTSSLMLNTAPASAHAPIEWSDPANDAVVTKLPEKITMRFGEDPVKLSIRTMELAPRTSIQLTPRKVGERTYEVPLPKDVIPRENGTLVMLISILSKDGHNAAGVYLLHVVSGTTTTKPQPAPTTAPRVVGPPGTTPKAKFSPPANDSSETLSLWLIISALSGAALLCGVTLHRVRSKR